MANRSPTWCRSGVKEEYRVKHSVKGESQKRKCGIKHGVKGESKGREGGVKHGATGERGEKR